MVSGCCLPIWDAIQSGAGRHGAVAAPLPCGPVPALKLRHCHTTTLPKGTSTPATCRQPSGSAVQSSGAHVLAALPAVAKMCKARRSRQACHWGRLPIRSGGLPICRRRFPYPVAFPICFRGSPCDSTASHTQAIFPYGIAVSPYVLTDPHSQAVSPYDPQAL